MSTFRVADYQESTVQCIQYAEFACTRAGNTMKALRLRVIVGFTAEPNTAPTAASQDSRASVRLAKRGFAIPHLGVTSLCTLAIPIWEFVPCGSGRCRANIKSYSKTDPGHVISC